MKLRATFLAASLLFAAGCATTASSDGALQAAASQMVSISQHGEDASPADIADLAAQLDETVAAAPSDPYVLKLAATARTTLAGYAQDRALRVRLRNEALAQLDKAIGLSKPGAPARKVMINGQEMDVDFFDLASMRASLFQTIQTDR